jgi:hypothetical protein
MHSNFLNRIIHRRARFIVATAALSAMRYHTANAALFCVLSNLNGSFTLSVSARNKIVEEKTL